MVKTGKLKYQSAFLLSEKVKDDELVIHGGTLFDYYFTFDKSNTSKARKAIILSGYLNGLLRLIQQNRNKPDLKIKGTTYILNKRTAEKIGFKEDKTDVVQKFILILNYPNLVATKSIANRKLSFPRLKSIKTYKTDIATLNENKEKIDTIRNRITNSLQQLVSKA